MRYISFLPKTYIRILLLAKWWLLGLKKILYI